MLKIVKLDPDEDPSLYSWDEGAKAQLMFDRKAILDKFRMLRNGHHMAVLDEEDYQQLRENK